MSPLISTAVVTVLQHIPEDDVPVHAFQVQDEYTEGEMVILGSWMYRWESMLALENQISQAHWQWDLGSFATKQRSWLVRF